MLTIKQILKATPKDRRIRSLNVKLIINKKEKQRISFTAYSIHDAEGRIVRNPKKYKVLVLMLDTVGSFKTAKVKVDCECADYWSTFEVALHKQGAADIKHSNGELPHIKNPTLVPGVCKHLYAALTLLLNK